MIASQTMNTGIPAEIMADAKLVAECVATGRVVPLDVARRVQERANCIRQEVLAKHGILDVGVPAIRAFRGELPQP
jgi:hypothetical protein